MLSNDQLLAPISAAQPSGEDLSFSADLDAISLARKFDDPSLDQGEWVTELKEADWDFVAGRCSALLAEKSKDLRLAVWLTEARAKKDQLRGLGEGYRVLAGLCNQFWDQGLHPQSDGADHEQRIGNLSWILARTPALVREMPLTEGRASAYSTIDFETARRQAAATGSSFGSDSTRAATGAKLAAMETARRNNSLQFCATFAADAQFCMDALNELEQAADARLGADSPGFSAARDALQAMLRAMPAVVGAGVDTTAVDVATTAGGGAPHAAQSGPTSAIQNRAQALAQLRLVAQFFRSTEPHSPVSYFADKAADAGEQNLHDWLRSVVKDSVSMSHIEELLGVKPASE